MSNQYSILNGKYLCPSDSGTPITLSLLLYESMMAISSAVSLKSYTLIFSSIRPLFTDFGMGIVPISICKVITNKVINKKKKTRHRLMYFRGI